MSAPDEFDFGPEPATAALPPLPGGLLARHGRLAVLVAVGAALLSAAVAVAVLLAVDDALPVRLAAAAGAALAAALAGGMAAARVVGRQRRAIGLGLGRLAEVVADASVRDDGARARIEGDDELARLGAGLDALLDRQLERSQQRADDDARLRAALAALAGRIDEVVRLRDLAVPIAMPAAGDIATGALVPVAEAVQRLLVSTAGWFESIADASREVAEATVAVRSHADQCRHAGAREQDDALLAARDIGQAAVVMHRIGEAARALRAHDEHAARMVESALDRLGDAAQGVAGLRDGLREAGHRIKLAGERATALSEVAAQVQRLARRAELLALNASMHAVGVDDEAGAMAEFAHEVERLAEVGRGSASEGLRLAESLRSSLSHAGQAADESLLRQADVARAVEITGRSLREAREPLTASGEQARQMAREAPGPTEAAPRLEEQARRIDDARAESLRLLDAQVDEARRLGVAARALLDRIGDVRLAGREARQ